MERLPVKTCRTGCCGKGSGLSLRPIQHNPRVLKESESRSHRLVVRSPPFQGGSTGSNPVGSTKSKI